MPQDTMNFSHTYPDFYNYFLTPHHAVHMDKLPSQRHEVPLPRWETLANMSFLRHQKHVHQDHNVPDADIRETRTAYYLDIELPGVGDKNTISIAWMSPRLLVVEGLINRLEVEGKPNFNTNGGHTNGGHTEGGSNPVERKKDPKEATQPHSGQQPWHEVVTLNERRIGVFSRHFTFASEVDNQALRAKLRDGLLSIVIPKVEHNIELGGKLAID